MVTDRTKSKLRNLINRFDISGDNHALIEAMRVIEAIISDESFPIDRLKEAPRAAFRLPSYNTVRCRKYRASKRQSDNVS